MYYFQTVLFSVVSLEIFFKFKGCVQNLYLVSDNVNTSKESSAFSLSEIRLLKMILLARF